MFFDNGNCWFNCLFRFRYRFNDWFRNDQCFDYIRFRNI